MNGELKQYTELRHNGNNRNISIAIIRTQERNSLGIEIKKKKRSETQAKNNNQRINNNNNNKKKKKKESNNSKIVNMAADSDRMKMSRLLNLAKKFNCFYLSGEFIRIYYSMEIWLNQAICCCVWFSVVNHLKSSVSRSSLSN